MNIGIIKNSDGAARSLFDYSPQHLAAIKKVIPTAEVALLEDEQGSIDAFVPQADILIVSSIKKIDFKQAKKLKWIHVTAAGVTDIAEKLQNSNSPILLTNSSGVHPIPISEHIFTYLLMFARQMHQAHQIQVKEKKWKRSGELLPVFELTGKTMGIVGYGHIGKRTAQIAKHGFNMRVLAYATSKKESPVVDEWFVGDQLHDLLRQSDFVINCLPLTNETQQMFNSQSFNSMKRSAYFINIGRGQTVVERDLVDALKNKVIAGAGLDVFETEPLPESSELWNLPNVIITPHYAGWTPKYLDRMIEIFCENLKAFILSQPLPNLVNKEKGY